MTKEGITLEQIAAQNEQLKSLITTIEGNLTEGRQARRAADNAAASIRIVEKKNLVLKNENTRLFRKIEDLGNLINEQAARIEELEEGQQQPQPARNICRDYEKALEATRKENGRLLNEMAEAQAENSKLKAAGRFDYEKVINALTMERDTFKAKYEENKKGWLDLSEKYTEVKNKLEADIEQKRKYINELHSMLDEKLRCITKIEAERAKLLEENKLIKGWLEKLGFVYVSLHPAVEEE